MNADYIKIAIRKRTQVLLYMAVEFSGSPLNNREFIEVVTNDQNVKPKIRDLSKWLKFGSYRLGRTFVYISRDKKFIRVALFSVNNSVVPGCESRYRYFTYIQNMETGELITENGKDNQRNIINFLSSQLEKPEDLIMNGPAHSLFIF